MKSDTALDYALFQLSPKRSRCELFVSRDGNSEKLASGLVKPFVTHLKIAEEQVALSNQSIKLEVEQRKNGEMWFTKGTLERFVRFVSTPEVLEMVNTFDAEMSQLESARVIYSQGVEDQPSSKLGGGGTGTTAAADATKKELLRAIDVRLAAVKQDLTTACARAAAAGFNPGAVSELQMFADQFGAYRLNEACSKFISLCERRPYLINPWKSGVDERTVRSSYGSDMSIDDDPSTEQPGRPHQPHISSAGQQSVSSSVTFPLRRTSRESSIEKDDTSSVTEKKEVDSSGGSESVLPATQPGAPARRLSVQDRISLFENKQKETSSASGGKPIVAKSAELRRLSSDVSSGSAAAEKAVLRRWSGVSDMSISLDLSGEKKDVDSPLCTPSVSSASQAKSDDLKRLNTTSDKPEFRSIPGISADSWSKDQVDSSVGEEMGTTKAGANSGAVSSGRSGDAYEISITGTVGTQAKTQSVSSLTPAGVKNQATSQSYYRSSSLDRADRFGFKDQGRPKGSYGNDEQTGTIEQVTSIARLKEGGGPQMKPGAFASKSGDVRSVKEYYQPPEGEDFEPRNQSVSQPRLMAPLKAAVDSGQLESGSKIREAFAAQYKGPEGMLLGSQSSWKSLREIEEIEQSNSSITKVEDSGIPGMKVQKQILVHQRIRKPQSRRNESNSVYGNDSTLFSHKMVTEDEEDFSMTPVTPAEQVQRNRQSKGNQELNDELKMKANELEKLFAEHKLRAPGDQSNSARRNKPADVQIEQASSLPDTKQVTDITPLQFLDNNTATDTFGSSSNVVKLTDGSFVKLVESQDCGDTLKCNISDLSLSDDSRGKFYDTYMQKRDVKLREEWGSRRTEKEAKLKAMQDSFERSRTEMRVKLSGSADRQDPIYSVHRRAERLRSFNTRSTLKMEQPLDFLQSEDDGDPFELLEQIPFCQDRSFSDVSLGNGVSRSSQTKRLLPNRNLSSFTPRNSAAPVPRSATKASNSGSVRRRMQSDNPLMQSVPNFSELRKENTKPYSASSKIVRPQLRNYTRSRSTSEDIPHVKEEKARRSQSLRKSTASPAEFKDMSSLNSDGVVLTPLKFDVEQAEEGRCDKFSKCLESKPFFQKNNSIGRGAGAGDAKLKASMVSESFSNDEESDELTFDPEDSADIVKDEDEEESLTRTSEDHVNMDHREPSLSQESAKLINSGSENGDALQSFSQDPSLLPSSMPSTFLPVGSVLDSPGESPMSWNSHIHHPFTCHHEVSDIDASADSPIGSPASWNLHPLNQTDSDAARMRKKWGSAQKPIIGANSSNNQSRKDMTKGFKRLLKFGRKSRGTENLVDWISATTSEGDDDMEDGRDLANRSSEDLRKSRMGFSQGHASEDSFNESEYFSEQVQGLNSSIPAPPANFKLREDHLSGSSMKGPRSFFSLSSFRSKGSESKLR